MTITDEKYFKDHSDVVQVAAYALHDLLHALKNDNCECLVSKEDGHLVVHYCKKRSVSTDAKSSACNDGNIEQDPSISRQQFDSLVSSILSKFPNASLSEFNGRSVIKYHGREFDLKNTYFLSKHPHFVRLLEQDMRTLDNYDYVVNHNIGESTIDLHDWNDVSNTKIPLNKEIFALIEDRMDSEKLRPEVIIAKMMPAKRLTWTESKEGDVLCYDVPSGNFHSCNGAQIKYWKHVNVPVRTRPEKQ